jgi:deoxyribonuclease-4
MGARNVTLHAGFYQTRTADQTYERIKKAMVGLQKQVARRKWHVTLCPEITGKPSQFGSLEELLRLKKETGCGITVDFSHLYARHQGVIDYGRILKKLPKKFHAHFSGIEYGPKGEKKHIRTTPEFFEPLAEKKHIRTTPEFFEPLARELVKRNPDITIISESPKPYEDAVMMKKAIKAVSSGE